MTPDLQTVYAWVRPGWDPSETPRTLPAIRLWGDVILELVAESQDRLFDPAVAIRRTAVFAWTAPVPPQFAASSTADRVRVELSVHGETCASADVELVNELFDPVAWRRLREWLIDRGHDRDFVEEDVVVFEDPLAAMLIESARDAVLSTSTELLGEIVSYFRPIAERYLATWSRLADSGADERLEVIVPAGAIAAVSN